MRAGGFAHEGLSVYVDNGHFDDIGRIANELTGEADRLRGLVVQREESLGRCVRPGELDASARDAFRALAARAAGEGRLATANRDSTLARQLQVAGGSLIGAEDITMAVWLALNIEPAYVGLSRGTYRRLNESVARTVVREMERLPVERAYYAVASAVDYNSAFDAGGTFARAGVDRVAIGFGAYMADNHSSDYVMVGRRRIDLGRRMPNRYVRTAVVARGFWDGYASVAGATPVAFHFLGLGAPITIGLVALAGWGTRLLSFDATSPIRDAVEGTMYVSAPAPLKLRTRRIVQQLASGDREEWNCPCPFCEQFVREHPFDYPAGHAWWAAHGREPNAADLRPGQPLFAAFPLFSEPSAGELRTSVNFTRMGHNHWALMKIVKGLNASSASRDRLAAFVEGAVERYERAAAEPRFASAVRLAYEIAQRGFDG